MIYAKTETGQRTTAYPGAAAWCPQCDAELKPKCGQIVTWHWAHISSVDCDPWAEPVSTWHLYWQSLVPSDRREVTIGRHRADLVASNGNVVEIQRSSISPDEIQEREEFYGQRMCWVFDAVDAYESDRLNLRRKAGAEPNFRTFRWKHPRKSVSACRRTVFLDLGEEVGVLRLGRVHTKAPCGGWGFLFTHQDLSAAFNSAEGAAA